MHRTTTTSYKYCNCVCVCGFILSRSFIVHTKRMKKTEYNIYVIYIIYLFSPNPLFAHVHLTHVFVYIHTYTYTYRYIDISYTCTYIICTYYICTNIVYPYKNTSNFVIGVLLSSRKRGKRETNSIAYKFAHSYLDFLFLALCFVYCKS